MSPRAGAVLPSTHAYTRTEDDVRTPRQEFECSSCSASPVCCVHRVLDGENFKRNLKTRRVTRSTGASQEELCWFLLKPMNAGSSDRHDCTDLGPVKGYRLQITLTH